MTPEQQTSLIDLAKTVLTSLVILLAAYLGYRFTIKQNKRQRQLEFIERKITTFYSPMIGYRNQIKAKSELRLDLSNAAGIAWGKICDEQPRPFLDHEKYFEPFKKLIEYNNKQFAEELLPMYDKMLLVFMENYWLANTSTQGWYGEFCRFVDLWHRFLNDSVPGRALNELKHGEELLLPFYDDLEKQLEELKQKIADG